MSIFTTILMRENAKKMNDDIKEGKTKRNNKLFILIPIVCVVIVIISIISVLQYL